MSCARNLFVLLAVLLVFAATACSRPRPPRAVVILVDTLRRDSLGCYGAPLDPTPIIDGLAGEGVRFEQAISSSGWTLPSVASLLTGTWPSIHKALGKSTRLTPISADVPTAAEAFSEAGFTTLAVANAAFLSPVLGLDRGFDIFDHRPAFNDRIRPAGESVDTALGMLADHPDEPVLLLLHLFDPHLDYAPAPRLAARFIPNPREPALPISAQDCLDIRGPGGGPPAAEDQEYVTAAYQAEVASVDQAIGRLFAGLRELDMYEDTWIILTADHGEEFWDHGAFEHGHTLYDELVRVPLIIRPPAASEHGIAVVESQVRVLDVMPTLFDAFGETQPTSFVGSSLLTVMGGTDRADRIAYSESTLYGADKIAFRNRRYKYVRNRGERARVPEELYDWRTDPGETENLIERRPDLASELRAELAAFDASIQGEVARTRAGEVEDINPATIESYEKSLESLGYADTSTGK
ncbi:MAG: choline-sulfatase [Chlamydiales bacterium]|jgi:choline-sulfatase